MVVAIGLAALMTAVSGAARTSGYLRDKTLAQWIALNRLAEVRLTVNKIARPADNTDAGQLDFANRTWHYDTRYFDTSIPTMKRVVVRVWAGDAKTKSNPLAESTSFLGTALGTPGGSNVDWTVGTTGPARRRPAPAARPARHHAGKRATGTGTASCRDSALRRPRHAPAHPLPAPGPPRRRATEYPAMSLHSRSSLRAQCSAASP